MKWSSSIVKKTLSRMAFDPCAEAAEETKYEMWCIAAGWKVKKFGRYDIAEETNRTYDLCGSV